MFYFVGPLSVRPFSNPNPDGKSFHVNVEDKTKWAPKWHWRHWTPPFNLMTDYSPTPTYTPQPPCLPPGPNLIKVYSWSKLPSRRIQWQVPRWRPTTDVISLTSPSEDLPGTEMLVHHWLSNVLQISIIGKSVPSHVVWLRSRCTK